MFGDRPRGSGQTSSQNEQGTGQHASNLTKSAKNQSINLAGKTFHFIEHGQVLRLAVKAVWESFWRQTRFYFQLDSNRMSFKDFKKVNLNYKMNSLVILAEFCGLLSRHVCCRSK